MTWGYSCYSGGRSYHHGYHTPTYSYKHSNDYAFYGKSYHYSYGGYSHYSKNHCGDYQYGKSYGGGHHGYQQYIIITKYKHHDDWEIGMIGQTGTPNTAATPPSHPNPIARLSNPPHHKSRLK